MRLSFNHVIIGGNLGADAETKYTPAGAARTTFSVATTRRWKDKQGERQESTTWHNVVMWDGAEWLAEALTKGVPVLVQGRIETRKYTDQQNQERSITEIVADKYMGVQPLRDNAQTQQQPPQQQQPVSAPRDYHEPQRVQGVADAPLDDDIPF